MRSALSALVILAGLLALPAGAFGQGDVEIWYGNLDGSPMEVQLGQEVLVPVYLRTASNVPPLYLSVVNLGSYDDYVISRSPGNLIAPLDQWDGYWYGPWPGSPMAGVTSNGWFGFTLIPYLPIHYETATMIMEFRMTVSSDPSLIGQTVSALTAGYNPNEPYEEDRITHFSDVGQTYYFPTEHFSDFTFQPEMAVPTISQWGMMLMGLLLAAVGTIAIIRKRPVLARG